jgi:hypothetical protein
MNPIKGAIEMVNTANDMVKKLLESRKELYSEGCEAPAPAPKPATDPHKAKSKKIMRNEP